MPEPGRVWPGTMKNWVRCVDSLLPCERMGMEKAAAPAAAPCGSRGSRLFAKGTSSCGRATAGALAAVGRTRRERPLPQLLLLVMLEIQRKMLYQVCVV